MRFSTPLGLIHRCVLETETCLSLRTTSSYLVDVFVVYWTVFLRHREPRRRLDRGCSRIEERGWIGSAVAILLNLAEQSLQVLHVQRLLLELLGEVDDFLAMSSETQFDVFDPCGGQIRVRELLLLLDE